MDEARTNKLDDLFAKWSQEYPDPERFVKDGIMCEDSWNATPRKILFVMKEANKGGDDLRKLCGPKDWPDLSRWAHGILHTASGVIPSYAEANKPANRQAGLKSAALMNLKKPPGGGSSNPSDIIKHADKDKDWIKKEISIISPDIIVCCGAGVLDGLRKVMPVEHALDDIPNCWFEEPVVLLRTCHFSLRGVLAEMKYYGLVANFAQALRILQSKGDDCPVWAHDAGA